MAVPFHPLETVVTFTKPATLADCKTAEEVSNFLGNNWTHVHYSYENLINLLHFEVKSFLGAFKNQTVDVWRSSDGYLVFLYKGKVYAEEQSAPAEIKQLKIYFEINGIRKKRRLPSTARKPSSHH